VLADGRCLYYCVCAAINAVEWLAHHDARGHPIGGAWALDRTDAAEVRDGVVAALRADGQQDEADCLMGTGFDAYPGMEDIAALATYLKGQVVVQTGPTFCEAIGVGPVRLHVVHTYSFDGEQKRTEHWELVQSWLPLDPEVLARELFGTAHLPALAEGDPAIDLIEATADAPAAALPSLGARPPPLEPAASPTSASLDADLERELFGTAPPPALVEDRPTVDLIEPTADVPLAAVPASLGVSPAVQIEPAAPPAVSIDAFPAPSEEVGLLAAGDTRASGVAIPPALPPTISPTLAFEAIPLASAGVAGMEETEEPAAAAAAARAEASAEEDAQPRGAGYDDPVDSRGVEEVGAWRAALEEADAMEDARALQAAAELSELDAAAAADAAATVAAAEAEAADVGRALRPAPDDDRSLSDDDEVDCVVGERSAAAFGKLFAQCIAGAGNLQGVKADPTPVKDTLVERAESLWLIVQEKEWPNGIKHLAVGVLVVLGLARLEPLAPTSSCCCMSALAPTTLF